VEANSHTKGRRPWTRFSLRALLIVMTALCLFLGWRTYHESKLSRIERRLDQLGVRCTLKSAQGGAWRRAVFGAAIYTRIDRILLQDAHVREGTIEEIVDLLLSWGGVREVVFDSLMNPIGGDAYEQIARLESLERIEFDYCEPRDVVAMQPLARLTRLKEISIEISWGKAQPFPFDFYLSLPSLKVLGLPGWSDEEAQYVARKRPDVRLEITDFPP
jgi:hypothetical protein